MRSTRFAHCPGRASGALHVDVLDLGLQAKRRLSCIASQSCADFAMCWQSCACMSGSMVL